MKTPIRWAAVLLAGSTLLTPAAAATLHVPSAYPTIQAALDAARSGDTVKVAPGVYFENLTIPRDVRLIGSGWAVTIIDGGGGLRCIDADSDNSLTIQGFTIRGARQEGIRLTNTLLRQATIKECRIQGNDVGIHSWTTYSVAFDIRNNQIVNNRLGVEVTGPSAVLQYNTIADNRTGVFVLTATIALINNIVAFNTYGVWANVPSSVTAIGDDTWSNSRGHYVNARTGQSYTPAGGNRISVDPRFVGGAAGYHLSSTSPCIGAAWVFSGRADLGALPYGPNRVFPATLRFGTSCGGASIGSYLPPVAGLANWDLFVTGAPASALGVLILGASNTSFAGVPLPIELTILGAPGCFLNISPDVLVPALTNQTGTFGTTLAIPNRASVVGQTFFGQWAFAGPGSLTFSDALRVFIGN